MGLVSTDECQFGVGMTAGGDGRDHGMQGFGDSMCMLVDEPASPKTLKAMRMSKMRESGCRTLPFAQLEAIGLRVHIEGGGYPEEELSLQQPERGCMRIAIGAAGLDIVDCRGTHLTNEINPSPGWNAEVFTHHEYRDTSANLPRRSQYRDSQ